MEFMWMTQGHLSVLLAQAALTTPQMGGLNSRCLFLTVLETGRLRPRCQWTQSLEGALPRLAEAALPLRPHMAESELSGSLQIRALITWNQGPTLITSSKPNHPEPHLQCSHTRARASRWALGATGIWSGSVVPTATMSTLFALTWFTPLGLFPQLVGVSPAVAVSAVVAGSPQSLFISHRLLAGEIDTWAPRLSPPKWPVHLVALGSLNFLHGHRRLPGQVPKRSLPKPGRPLRARKTLWPKAHVAAP